MQTGSWSRVPSQWPSVAALPDAAFSPIGNLASQNKVVELVGDFVPNESGSHCLSCSDIGPVQMSINDTLVLDQTTNSPDSMGALFAENTDPEVRLRMYTRPLTDGLPLVSILEGPLDSSSHQVATVAVLC